MEIVNTCIILWHILFALVVKMDAKLNSCLTNEFALSANDSHDTIVIREHLQCDGGNAFF